MTKEQLLEIGRWLQKRCTHLKEIESLTEQASEAFGRNDSKSAALLLEMRGEQMEQADLCRERAGALMKDIGGLEFSALDRLMHAHTLSDDGLYERFSEEEKEAAARIAAVSIRSRAVLKETIRKDRRLNQKIAGKNTFYQGKD